MQTPPLLVLHIHYKSSQLHCVFCTQPDGMMSCQTWPAVRRGASILRAVTAALFDYRLSSDNHCERRCGVTTTQAYKRVGTSLRCVRHCATCASRAIANIHTPARGLLLCTTNRGDDGTHIHTGSSLAVPIVQLHSCLVGPPWACHHEVRHPWTYRPAIP